ncbi:hypothetical protein TNCV_194681 [Trichonephila clavipes]|nr:hypothetical protein TNCV_194681 [Trichonephila clavipes]
MSSETNFVLDGVWSYNPGVEVIESCGKKKSRISDTGKLEKNDLTSCRRKLEPTRAAIYLGRVDFKDYSC